MHHRKKNESIDHDNDPYYRTPRAWWKAKKAFNSQYSLERLMCKLERIDTLACPRYLLAAAIHHFVTRSSRERAAIVLAFADWSDKEFEADIDFRKAMNRIMREAESQPADERQV